jgi:hypothetical protein
VISNGIHGIKQRRLRQQAIIEHIALRELSEGAGKETHWLICRGYTDVGGLRRNLCASFPTTDAAQRSVDGRTLDDGAGARILSTALATKAPGGARRSSGVRPSPLGASGTKASRPIASRMVVSRPSSSVIGSTNTLTMASREFGHDFFCRGPYYFI